MAGSVFKISGITLTAYNPAVVRTIVGAASANAGRRAVKYARQELSKGGHDDTGLLSHSIKSRLIMTALGPSFEIYSELEYSRWVNDGTGVYGPYGSPIVTPSGGVMKFNPGRRNSGAAGVGRRRSSTSFGGGGQFTGAVYSMTVQGQPATKFIDKAIARIKITDFFV